MNRISASSLRVRSVPTAGPTPVDETNTAVIARLDLATQYSRDGRAQPRSCGVLDRPVKPGDDSLVVAEVVQALVSGAWQCGPQRRDDRIQPIRQRSGSGLQDQRRLDLDDAVVTNGRNLVPARPLSDFIRNDLLAVPGRQDDIRRRGSGAWRGEGANACFPSCPAIAVCLAQTA